MKKSNNYAKNGAILLGIGNGFWNVINQLERIKNDQNLKFNWLEFIAAIGKGAIVGGVGGYALGWVLDYKNSKQKPLDLDAELNNLVNTRRLNPSDQSYNNLKLIVDTLNIELNKEFAGKIDGELITHGSTEKGTALKENYDIDIAIPFKPKSFQNSSLMFEAIKDFFENKIGEHNIVDVRKQKRSIGVYVNPGDQEFRIDFAPFKLSKYGQNSGYLFVNKKGFFIDNSTIQKTNLKLLKSIKLSDIQKKIVVLIKDWKTKQELPLPSHLLEYLVLDAYKHNNGKLL